MAHLRVGDVLATLEGVARRNATHRGECRTGKAALGMDCGLASLLLPAGDRDVDITGVELESVGDTAGVLGCDDRRAAAGEGVEYEIAPPCAVPDRVRHQGHRLHGRMHRQ